MRMLHILTDSGRPVAGGLCLILRPSLQWDGYGNKDLLYLTLPAASICLHDIVQVAYACGYVGGEYQ